MTLAIVAVFVAALAGIVILTVLDGRRQRAARRSEAISGSQSSWTEVSQFLELELSPWTTPDEASMRGTVGDHWVSVEQHDDGIEIVVNYRSGLNSFEAAEPDAHTRDSSERFLTGDDAFDSKVAVFTRSATDLEAYLSPARRNALLWLQSSFRLGDIDHEMLDVKFSEPQWHPGQLIAAIKLVIDVAGIMEPGEKVFMSPPLATVAATPQTTETNPTMSGGSADDLTWGPRLVGEDETS